jgi:hypothetical protein
MPSSGAAAMATTKKWSAKLSTDSTHPEEGPLQQEPGRDCQISSLKEGLAGLRDEDAELLHQSRRKEPFCFAPRGP